MPFLLVMSYPWEWGEEESASHLFLLDFWKRVFWWQILLLENPSLFSEQTFWLF